MTGLVLVVLTLLAVIAVQAAIWIPLVSRWRRRRDRFVEDLRSQAAASGEQIVAGPEQTVYRGGGKPYSAVKGNGTIILTDRRLVFRKLTGGILEVPVANIAGVRQEKGFRGSRVGGMTHLVITTTDPAEIGFFVQDLATWQRALDPPGTA